MAKISLAQNQEEVAIDSSRRPYYPTIHLYSKQIPKNLKPMGVGDKKTIEIEVMATNKNENIDGNGSITLDILSIDDGDKE